MNRRGSDEYFKLFLTGHTNANVIRLPMRCDFCRVLISPFVLLITVDDFVAAGAHDFNRIQQRSRSVHRSISAIAIFRQVSGRASPILVARWWKRQVHFEVWIASSVVALISGN